MTAFDVAVAGLDLPGADAVEVRLVREDSALTRYAESQVTQSTARVDGEARVRVVVDGARVGVASTNDLTPDGVRAAGLAARDAARHAPRDPEYAGLPGPAAYPAAGADDPATAATDPEQRALLVKTMLEPLGRNEVAAGIAETARYEHVVVNTNGVRAHHAGTRAGVTCLVSGPDSTGYAEQHAVRVGDLDASAVAARAVAKVAAGRHPVDVDPGDWAVVLEPAATAALVEWLGWLAFGGRDVLEGRSAISGRLGEQVCSPLVTIVDDPLDPGTPGVPFDAEGVPARALDLVRDGRAVGVTYDTTTARKAGTASTGHALPAPNPDGPYPLHAAMLPGAASLDELVAGCARGLLVTRFHYTNAVHALTTMLTGMTRDGTFLIEDGRVVGGVRNLRFTESVLGTFGTVEAVGSDVALSGDEGYATRAPAVRLGRFHFSSATTF